MLSETLNIMLRVLVIALLTLALAFSVTLGILVIRVAYEEWKAERRRINGGDK